MTSSLLLFCVKDALAITMTPLANFSLQLIVETPSLLLLRVKRPAIMAGINGFVSFKFIVESISEGARFAPNFDRPRKLIVNFLKIPFHFCEDYRIFREGEYQVKNDGYAIDKQRSANIPDVGIKQQRSNKLNRNAIDEHQHDRKNGKAINSAKTVDLTIMVLPQNVGLLISN